MDVATAPDSGAGAAGRSSGCAWPVPRIARRSVVRVGCYEVIGVLAHVGGAQTDRAGGGEPFDGGGGITRRRRIVRVDPGPGYRRDAFEVEQVFHRIRNAGEGARVASGGDGCIDSLSLAQSALPGDQRVSIEARVQRFDASEASFSDRLGGEATSLDSGSNLVAGKGAQIDCHGMNLEAGSISASSSKASSGAAIFAAIRRFIALPSLCVAGTAGPMKRSAAAA
jgi:hypothetical protein